MIDPFLSSLKTEQIFTGDSSNGRTGDFESSNGGSSPSSPTKPIIEIWAEWSDGIGGTFRAGRIVENG